VASDLDVLSYTVPILDAIVSAALRQTFIS